MGTIWRYMGQDYRLVKVSSGYDIYIGTGWVAWTAGSISDAHDTVRSMANTPAVLTDKPERIALTAPYSEVCMHLRVAGHPVLVEPRPNGMAQLRTVGGVPISFPITRGEAGLHATEDRPLHDARAFTHDCEDCVFLGHWQGRDLYFCPNEPTVIARSGSEGPDYSSGLDSRSPSLVEARRRAVGAGLWAPPCMSESQAGTREQDDEDELLDRLLLRFPAENRVDPMKPGRAQ